MATIGRVVVGPTDPKNVVVRPSNRTSISSPNFNPKMNVAISDITDMNVDIRREGDVLVYDSATGKYISAPLGTAQVDITNINGGRF